MFELVAHTSFKFHAEYVYLVLYSLGYRLSFQLKVVSLSNGNVYGADSLPFNSQIVEKESLLESEGGHVSTISAAPDTKDAHSDGFASGETQIDRQKYNTKHSLSPSYCENKSAYSSMVRVLYNGLAK